MVRAGAVIHPCDWPDGGFSEIQQPPDRYRIIDTPALIELLDVSNSTNLKNQHQHWIEAALKNGATARQPIGSKSLAVGSDAFVQGIKTELGILVRKRSINQSADATVLMEPEPSYTHLSLNENSDLSISTQRPNCPLHSFSARENPATSQQMAYPTSAVS